MDSRGHAVPKFIKISSYEEYLSNLLNFFLFVFEDMQYFYLHEEFLNNNLLICYVQDITRVYCKKTLFSPSKNVMQYINIVHSLIIYIGKLSNKNKF